MKNNKQKTWKKNKKYLKAKQATKLFSATGDRHC